MKILRMKRRPVFWNNASCHLVEDFLLLITPFVVLSMVIYTYLDSLQCTLTSLRLLVFRLISLIKQICPLLEVILATPQ